MDSILKHVQKYHGAFQSSALVLTYAAHARIVQLIPEDERSGKFPNGALALSTAAVSSHLCHNFSADLLLA
jgi:hypothetical protein